MKLAISRQGAAIGAVAGALGGFLLIGLGLGEVSGHAVDPDWVGACAVIGGLVGLLRGQWIVVIADAALALVYFAAAETPLMTALARRWVRSDPVPASADAIVVLSAAVLADSALDVQGTERLLSGLELYQMGVAPRLFTTRVEIDYADGIRSSTPDQARLVKLAGATAGWTVLEGVFTTRDEALQSAVKLPEGARRLVVVTSPMHTRRACATFEAVGFAVSCHPARGRDYSTWVPVERMDRLAAFREYLYERLGMVKYRWKHWLPAGV